MEKNTIHKYILMEYIEPDLCEPKLFDTYEEAYDQMRKFFLEARNISEEEYEEELSEGNGEDGTGLEKWEAYCKNKNHDYCCGKISEIEIPL